MLCARAAARPSIADNWRILSRSGSRRVSSAATEIIKNEQSVADTPPCGSSYGLLLSPCSTVAAAAAAAAVVVVVVDVFLGRGSAFRSRRRCLPKVAAPKMRCGHAQVKTHETKRGEMNRL